MSGDPTTHDREARRHRVTAVLDQQIVALVERFRDVHRRDRSARPLALLTVDGDDDRGAAVVLHQSRRAEAHDARGPGRVRDDGRPRVGPLLGPLARALDDLTCEVLPLRVLQLQVLGEDFRLIAVLREQQPQRFLRVRDPPGGIQPRAEDVADVRRGHVTELEAGPLHERAHAGDRRATHGLEAGAHQKAVRASQRHHVGHGRERHELHELVAAQRKAQLAEQSARENECDARASELLVE